MDRRSFNKLMSAGAIGISADPRVHAQIQQTAAVEDAMRPSRWPDQVFRRLLVDTHVPDWDPLFLSRLDPVEYVDCIARAGSTQTPARAFACGAPKWDRCTPT